MPSRAHRPVVLRIEPSARWRRVALLLDPRDCSLEYESDGHFSLLPRLCGLDAAECIRAHVCLIERAQASKIIAPQ